MPSTEVRTPALQQRPGVPHLMARRLSANVTFLASLLGRYSCVLESVKDEPVIVS